MKYFLLLLSSLIPYMTQAEEANILVQIEHIQLPKGTIEKLIKKEQSTGTKLRKAVQILISKDQAKVLETSLISVRPSERARVKSTKQYIYPTEYDPPTHPSSINGNDQAWLEQQQKLYDEGWIGRLGAYHMITAFEERPLGTLLEVETSLSTQQKFIKIDLEVEKIALSELRILHTFNDKWGKSDTRMPTFDQEKQKLSLTLQAGKYSLVHYGHSKKAKDNISIAVFARAIIKQPSQ